MSHLGLFIITESEIPRVILGYDDYGRNITTIQCVVTEAEHPHPKTLIRRVELRKNRTVLRSWEYYNSTTSPIISLDVSPGEKDSGNYHCMLDLSLRDGSKTYEQSAHEFTKIEGKFMFYFFLFFYFSLFTGC